MLPQLHRKLEVSVQVDTGCPVSVVLATYNRANFLRRNVPRVLEQLGPRDELLILDNNSTDDTTSYVSTITNPAVRYLRVARQGLNVCRNVALDEARHDNIAFIDDDAWPTPGWLASFRQARLAWPNAAMLCGKTELEFECGAPRSMPSKYQYLFGAIDYGAMPRILTRSESPGGGNMMVDRQRLLCVSRFDENLDRRGALLLSNGETEVAAALRTAGCEVLYVPGATIRHWAGRERVEGNWIFRRMYFQGVSDGLVAAKRNRFLVACLKRLAFHASKGLVETIARLDNPKAMLLGATLEIVKTTGTFAALRYAP